MLSLTIAHVIFWFAPYMPVHQPINPPAKGGQIHNARVSR